MQKFAIAGEIADEAARFLDEQAAGGDVPRVEPDFPEPVVETRRDIGEIERGGAGPAQAGGLLDHCLHHPHVGIEIAAVAEGKAGADEAVAQMLALGDADAAVVQERTAPAGRREEIVAHRVVDHAVRDLAAVRERDRNAVLRKAVQEVGRAVERVDDPDVFRVGVGAFGGAFLC